MRAVLPVLAAVFGLLFAARAGAAQCTGTPQALNPAPSPASVLLPTPVDGDFEAGYVTYSGVLTVTINPANNGRPYALCAHAGTPDMGVSDSGGYIKLIGDLQVKSTSATGYVALNQSEQPLVSNLKKTQTVTLDIQVRVTWDDEPGRYVSAIVLTAYQ